MIFDHDGTLIDSSVILTKSFAHAAHELGLPEPSQDRVVKTIGRADQWKALFGFSSSELVAIFLDYYYANHLREIRLFPGMNEILVSLRDSGFNLAVSSNKLKRAGLSELEACGIAQHFSYALWREDVAQPKPHPEGINAVLHALACSSGRACYVGDTALDVRAARAAGVRSIAVLWGYGTAADLAPEAPDVLCASPDELLFALSRSGLEPGERA